MIIHDDKNDDNDAQIKQNDVSSRDTQTKRLRRDDDGVQEKVRSKRSNEDKNGTTNKRDVVGQHTDIYISVNE